MSVHPPFAAIKNRIERLSGKKAGALLLSALLLFTATPAPLLANVYIPTHNKAGVMPGAL
jgi:hypothetical protein